MKITKIISGMIVITLALVGMGATVGQSSDPDVYWRGDGETGDLSQWNPSDKAQISVVTSPVTQGCCAYQFILPASYISPNGKEAVWLHSKYNELSGEEKFYRWDTFISTEVCTNTSWMLFQQFKGYGTGSPPLALGCRSNRFSVNSNPKSGTGSVIQLASWPADKDRWNTFVFHVKWSADPKVGFVEVWYNGEIKLPKTYTSTIHLANGSPVRNYVDLGIYRDPSINETVTFYHDGFVVGKTYSSVTGELSVTSVPPTSTYIVTSPTLTPSKTPNVIASPTVTRTATASRTPTRTPVPSFTATATLTFLPATPSATSTSVPTCYDVYRFRNYVYEKIGYICP